MQETVIVFGGSYGIGEVAAKRLLEDGLRVEGAVARLGGAVESASVDATRLAVWKAVLLHSFRLGARESPCQEPLDLQRSTGR